MILNEKSNKQTRHANNSWLTCRKVKTRPSVEMLSKLRSVHSSPACRQPFSLIILDTSKFWRTHKCCIYLQTISCVFTSLRDREISRRSYQSFVNDISIASGKSGINESISHLLLNVVWILYAATRPKIPTTAENHTFNSDAD